MKRSEVNQIMREGDAFIRSFGFVLPPFAYYTPDEMRQRADTNIYRDKLGWDITDFGAGNFDDFGLFLFTVRNGPTADLKAGRGMLYAEKIMIVREKQVTPTHRHNIKVEDIINRGGGTLTLELNVTGPGESVDQEAEVSVLVDGEKKTMPAGDKLRLEPGQSVTLFPNVWHSFWAEGKDCLIGEVSTVNDDVGDNVFAKPIGRFADIEEDEAPLHLLVADYDGGAGSY